MVMKLLSTLFVILTIILGAVFWYLPPLPSFTPNKTAKHYPTNSVSVHLRIKEDTNGKFWADGELYDNKKNFIEENATLLLNGKAMHFSKSPDGYYGYHRVYYIQDSDFNTTEKQSKKFNFTLVRNGKEIELLSFDKPSPFSSKDITCSKNGDIIQIRWKNLDAFDTLSLVTSGVTIKEVKIAATGDYSFSLKSIDLTKHPAASKDLTCEFSGNLQRKINNNSAYNSWFEYHRQYSLQPIDLF